MTQMLTLADAIDAHARVFPDKIGARDSTRSLTFAQWNDRTARLANALDALGLATGDKVAILAWNCVEWAEIYVALTRAGLVAVPINFRLVGPEIAFILAHSESRAIIVQDGLQDRLDGLAELEALAPGGRIHFGGATPPGWSSYETLIVQASAEPMPVRAHPDDTMTLMYTSGTTGRPKGALRGHGANAVLGLATALEMEFTRHDTALLVMPMCHANSLNFFMTFVHLGATCVVDDRKSFDAEQLLATLSREKVTFTSLVPTHFIMMLGLPAAVKARHDVSAVQKLLVSSAPTRKETKLAILDHFRQARLFELYGSSEAGWVTLLRPEEQIEHLGSIGREWAHSGAIRMLDPDGNEVADGEVGELFSRTPYVFDGYWKNPEKTEEAFRGAWCSVGDMARRDERGYIHLVDRKANMIISGGENVYPSEVEGVLGAHPMVRDIAVVGVPHAKWGETVQAVIVLHETGAVTERELLDWCKDRMAGFKRPSAILFIQDDEMPRNATGKILHRALRERLAATSGS